MSTATTGTTAATPVTPTCDVMLHRLHNALIDLASGTNQVEFEMQSGPHTRRMRYGQGNIAALEKLYRTYYAQCGAASGLPNIADGSSTRGPAACFVLC